MANTPLALAKPIFYLFVLTQLAYLGNSNFIIHYSEGEGDDYENALTTPVTVIEHEFSHLFEIKRLNFSFDHGPKEIFSFIEDDCVDDANLRCKLPRYMRLCHNKVYKRLMKDKCRKTCGMCPDTDFPQQPDDGCYPDEFRH
ncbi:unnamed protein product [Bursaphelenchus xylophilus]|uniref:(pine wood nematode) hypothetical protein n=1 Tax=Bursaphelenchus xylophilus TaxID=6326 RepID=A0A1I7S152_BURXY|nr:unnamed protein product [Bursaphelenchus xylophilus]CAG9079985.1 unnamed protein product [Bursaphelenchus xylophilus]